LADSAGVTCVLEIEDKHGPNWDIKRATLSCGSKRVEIAVLQESSKDIAVISEVLE
jgi:hypothetical protein